MVELALARNISFPWNYGPENLTVKTICKVSLANQKRFFNFSTLAAIAPESRIQLECGIPET